MSTGYSAVVRYRPGGTLPCLSVLQPWAYLICAGHKDVENRVWNTRKRGTILIHTGKRASEVDFAAAERTARACGVKDMPRGCLLGGIVGAAEILDVVQPGGPKRPWYDPDQFGFVLGRGIALPFRPLSGARQFFQVEPTKVEVKALRSAGLLL